VCGELSGVTAGRRDYVARRMRWSEYVSLFDVSGIRFHTTYLVEELEPDHHEWIVSRSENVISLELRVEPQPAAPDDYWLIVHSGPAHEVCELIDYARERALRAGKDPRLVVATRSAIDLPPGVTLAGRVPPYASAERIISAAGFNVMLETEAWSDKHDVLPFPRRFDDQYARAASRRARRLSARASEES
jgi:hypothetical protein